MAAPGANGRHHSAGRLAGLRDHRGTVRHLPRRSSLRQHAEGPGRGGRHADRKGGRADVRGRVPSEGEISIDFENVPLHEALGRLFGERNFAITYGADGKATAIELFGAPLPAPPKPAAAEASVAPAEQPGWPPDDKTKAAVATLRAFLERNPSVDLDPELAAVAGAKTTTFVELMKIAAQNDDRRVRTRAWNQSLRTMRDDPEVWEALVVVMNTAPEDSMRDFARNQLGPNAEELTRQLIRQAGPQLRAPARAVLERLAADPTAGAAVPAPATP